MKTPKLQINYVDDFVNKKHSYEFCYLGLRKIFGKISRYKIYRIYYSIDKPNNSSYKKVKLRTDSYKDLQIKVGKDWVCLMVPSKVAKKIKPYSRIYVALVEEE